MDDFKFNAEKILAAQKAKDRRAQSPETESNWDSSEPEEDDTVTQISSEEEFSVQSTKSHKSIKSNKTSKTAVKAEVLKVKSPSKPDVATPNKKSAKPTNDSHSAAKSPPRSAVNVFVDRGQYDSDGETSQRSTTKKTRKKKEEKPPYDFRNAIKDDDADDPPSQGTAPRPGRSRKGESYDPAPAKMKAKPQQEQFPGTDSWDVSDENARALAQLSRERDGDPSEVKDNNNDEGDQKKKKKGWSIRMKKKSSREVPKQKEETTMGDTSPEKTRRKEDKSRRTEVAIATPPKPALQHTEVDLSDLDENEASHAVISLGSNEYQSTRYVYIYHHGNTSYHDTRQAQEEVYMTRIADKSERVFRRCAQEVFATFRILVDFFLIFLLEGLRFVAFNIVGNLLVGLLTGFGDFFLRPFSAALFNGLCQPTAMLFYNVGVAMRTATGPFLDILRSFLTQISMLVRSFRLVEINWKNGHQNVVEDV